MLYVAANKGLVMSKEKYWIGTIGGKDDFGATITTDFVDGKTWNGPWAIMAPSTWKRQGCGKLGLGFGQWYRKQADGRWLKVEG
jgi:hypothetical protein